MQGPCMDFRAGNSADLPAPMIKIDQYRPVMIAGPLLAASPERVGASKRLMHRGSPRIYDQFEFVGCSTGISAGFAPRP
jgi:hypothetical protein